jgi:hypothetical protein
MKMKNKDQEYCYICKKPFKSNSRFSYTQSKEIPNKLEKICFGSNGCFPKLYSPFIREHIDGNYVCTPEVNDEYRWIFDTGIAVEKLDGTNISIIVEDGRIVEIYNRMNNIPIFSKGNSRFMEGIQAAIDKKYFKIKEDGQYFGELCGESINKNPLHLKGHLWFPFERLKERNRYKFWNDINFINKSDQKLYNFVSDLFKDLWSLEIRKRTGNIEYAEGIVFYNKETDQKCKLRRDMFDWYRGEKHY